MPSGLSRAPTLREKCRQKFGSDKPFWFLGAVAAPLVAGAFIGETIAYVGQTVREDNELRHQTRAQTESNATRLWRENGYEVTGFKSYDVLTSRDRSITLVLKNAADGKAYEGTALCSKNCAIRKIAAGSVP